MIKLTVYPLTTLTASCQLLNCSFLAVPSQYYTISLVTLRERWNLSCLSQFFFAYWVCHNLRQTCDCQGSHELDSTRLPRTFVLRVLSIKSEITYASSARDHTGKLVRQYSSRIANLSLVSHTSTYNHRCPLFAPDIY